MLLLATRPFLNSVQAAPLAFRDPSSAASGRPRRAGLPHVASSLHGGPPRIHRWDAGHGAGRSTRGLHWSARAAVAPAFPVQAVSRKAFAASAPAMLHL